MTVPGLADAPTTNPKLLAWVREVAELTQPDRVVWCDGSPEEADRLFEELVNSGTIRRLNPAVRPPSTKWPSANRPIPFLPNWAAPLANLAKAPWIRLLSGPHSATQQAPSQSHYCRRSATI